MVGKRQEGAPGAAVPPLEADPERGLTAAEARLRAEAGLSNKPVEAPSKTVGQIVFSNVFTYFNMLFLLLAACVAAVGSWLDLTFLGVIVFNTLIGIVQELRSKRTLDRLRILTSPRARAVRDGRIVELPTAELVRDDIVVLSAGEQICADGELVSGALRVNEALVTGEADEIAKAPGDALLSGSFAVGGEGRARLTAVGEASFAAKLTLEARASRKPRQSEMMRSLSRLVKVIGFIVVPLGAVIFCKEVVWLHRDVTSAVTGTVAAVIGMIPEGLYLLTSLALIAGILRLVKKKTLLHDMAAIETLARVDVLCVDKTGTVTENKMTVEDLCLLNETSFPEGEVRQVLADYVYAMSGDNETLLALRRSFSGSPKRKAAGTLPFSSERKFGGADLGEGGVWLLGAPEVLLKLDYADYQKEVETWAEKGCRVLLLARLEGTLEAAPAGRLRPAALVLLANKIRREAPDTFRYFAEQGVTVKVISGDNPVTVSEVARRAAIPDAEKYVDAQTLTNDAMLQAAARQYTVFGRVKPEQKRKLVQALKAAGHTVAMTGDGVNDVLALKTADCGIALASGSDAACQAANIVLLNSDFSSMPSVVDEGRRVINNIGRSASLYLTKNIFSFCLALFTLLVALPYPFSPAGLSIVNGLTIGIPSFVLAMEPNRSRVEGRFLPRVLYRALPAALTDFLLVLGMLFFFHVTEIPTEPVRTVATGIMGVVGVLMVDRTSRPYTPLRRALVIGIAAAFAAAFLFFKPWFSLPPLGKQGAAVFAVFALLAKPLMDLLSRGLDALRAQIGRIRGEWDI
ncbi:MAG: HAD-IC family P-type ATPase [Oscillospiraceae bacterium]|nr:HAD-IC family P-type ATPase [Oscillospiraceae bacterium]